MTNRNGEESKSFNTIDDLAEMVEYCEECGNCEAWCDCDEPKEIEGEGREYNPDDRIYDEGAWS